MEMEETKNEEALELTKEEKIKTKKSAKKDTAAKPSWVKLTNEEFEKIVVDLGKQGKSPAAIGLILRDQHGVPKASVFGKSIEKVLIDNGVKFKTLQQNTEESIANLRRHIEKNKKDHGSTRALTKKLWKIYRFERN